MEDNLNSRYRNETEATQMAVTTLTSPEPHTPSRNSSRRILHNPHSRRKTSARKSGNADPRQNPRRRGHHCSGASRDGNGMGASLAANWPEQTHGSHVVTGAARQSLQHRRRTSRAAKFASARQTAQQRHLLRQKNF